MDKSSLRKLFLAKRSEFTSAELDLASNLIAQQFSSIPLNTISYLHCFYPIVGKFEVDCLKIVSFVKESYPHIKLVLSRTDFSNYTLVNYLWDDHTTLAVNEWGITEPTKGTIVDPQLIDMVLVPLLVVDKRGNRVGYGKGFYDRFLSGCRLDVKKVGLSFFDPVDEEISDTNEFDVPLDICVTPTKAWQF